MTNQNQAPSRMRQLRGYWPMRTIDEFFYGARRARLSPVTRNFLSLSLY